MIQTQTILNVADNSGAKKVKCIKVLGGSKKSYAKIGQIIKVAVQSINSSSGRGTGGKINKGSVYNAIVVRTKFPSSRKDGSVIRFDDNAVVLVNASNQMIGTRVLGPVARELRFAKSDFFKILSLAKEVL